MSDDDSFLRGAISYFDLSEYYKIRHRRNFLSYITWFRRAKRNHASTPICSFSTNSTNTQATNSKSTSIAIMSSFSFMTEIEH